MDKVDRLTVGAADKRVDNVSLVESCSFEVFNTVNVIVEVILESSRLAGAAGQRKEPVAAVYAEQFGDRAKLMGGIELAVSVDEVVQAAVPQLPSVEDLVTEIVTVSAGAVDDFTEHTETLHPEDRQLVPAVAAVLQHHAMLAGLLLSADQIPALLDI